MPLGGSAVHGKAYAHALQAPRFELLLEAQGGGGVVHYARSATQAGHPMRQSDGTQRMPLNTATAVAPFGCARYGWWRLNLDFQQLGRSVSQFHADSGYSA